MSEKNPWESNPEENPFEDWEKEAEKDPEFAEMLAGWKDAEKKKLSGQVDYRESDEDYEFFVEITDEGDILFNVGNSEKNRMGNLIGWVEADPDIKKKLKDNKIDTGFYPAYFTIEPNPSGNSWRMRTRLKNDESIKWELNIDKLAVLSMQKEGLVEEGTVSEEEANQITDEIAREDDDENEPDESDDIK